MLNENLKLVYKIHVEPCLFKYQASTSIYAEKYFLYKICNFTILNTTLFLEQNAPTVKFVRAKNSKIGVFMFSFLGYIMSLQKKCF